MNISLANKLSRLRRESNLSEDELSSFINVPALRIRGWETADSEPTASELFELSKLYHISIDELIKSEETTAENVSLTKKTHTAANDGFIREKRPEHYTDQEIYPKEHSGGVRFVGASDDGFQNSPYTKAEDIKSRDTSHVKFAEPETPNIKVKTAHETPKQSANTAGKSIDGLIGKIPPDVAAKISDTLGKAGHIIGDTIDKVGDAIQRTSSEAANPKTHTENGQYTPPPKPNTSPDQEYEYKGQYYANREREKWLKKEEKLRNREMRRAKKKHRSLFYKTFPLIMTTLFFVFGAMGGFEWSWLFFLLIPIYYTLIEAVEKGDLRRFAYPVAVVFGFMVSGFLFNNWGPAAFMFLTIPFYYILADHLKTKKEDMEKDKENTL
jgi:transcriptional regulator with XRE-family HTH domain